MSSAPDPTPHTHVDSDEWPDAPTLGRRLRNMRRARGLTQDDVTNGVVAAAYLSRIESGQRFPSIDVLTVFAERLGVSVDTLLAPEIEQPHTLSARVAVAEQVAARAAAWLADPTDVAAYAQLVEAVDTWNEQA